MYIIQTNILDNIISFLDKYKSKTSFIKSYGMSTTKDKVTILLNNDASIVFATGNTKQYIQWPSGATASSRNDDYYVLGLQSKYIFQNAGVFLHGRDLVSGVTNIYLINDGRCHLCNSQTDLNMNNDDYSMAYNLLQSQDRFTSANTPMIISLGVFVQQTTVKLDSIAVINQVFYDNMTNYSEAAVISDAGVDLYYLFKLPSMCGYLDGFWRYYALIDDDGYQN